MNTGAPILFLKNFYYFRTVLLFVLVLLSVYLPFIIPVTAEAQNRVRILQSDRLEGVTTEDGRIRKLLGNVRLETDDFSIVCDSAWQYLDIDELIAFGDIEIKTEREHIWSDKATYDLQSEITLFEGRVILKSENVLLFSQLVYYSFETEIALFPEYIRLEDDRGVLAADSGYYYSALDSAIFRGNVQISDSLQYIEADSVFTRRNNEYYELHGRVFLNDDENRTQLTGAYVQSDSTGYRKIEGDSRMRQHNESGTDTTWLWSDWLEVTKNDTINTFSAYDNVHIWSESYSSVSDTAHYDESTDQFILLGNPRLWYDDMQLTGPNIIIQFESDTVRYLKSFPRPFAVQQDTAVNRLNQITGDTIYINFDDGKISHMDVNPAGNVLYFVKDSAGEADGAIEMTADTIKLVFVKEELEDVIARSNVDGNWLPERSGLTGRRLDGFIWEPDLRPQKPEVMMEPRLPPIPEERPFNMPARFQDFSDLPQ